jgi:hypothetical protein
MNHGLSNETVMQMRTVFSHFPAVEQVILYGSRAKGDYRQGSDIDLTLIGEVLTRECSTGSRMNWMTFCCRTAVIYPCILTSLMRNCWIIFAGWGKYSTTGKGPQCR